MTKGHDGQFVKHGVIGRLHELWSVINTMNKHHCTSTYRNSNRGVNSFPLSTSEQRNDRHFVAENIQRKIRID